MTADRIFREGETFGDRFVLEEQLGVGSFGAVWRARDQHNESLPVAIKLLLDKHREDKKKLQRFTQEARILDRLSHPNIAQPIAWSAEGHPFLVMEFVDGETLDARLIRHSRESNPIPPSGVAWIVDQLAAAIDYAHTHHVIHRDLKPRNVMINRRGERPFVKVLDFGIAKMLVGSEIDPTTVGRVLGSVLYIAPEQILSRTLDHRADIFSLGSIVFELLTLRRAWARDETGRALEWHRKVGEVKDANNHVEVLRRIGSGLRSRPSADRPELPPSVDDVMARALAIEAGDRYPSAIELAHDLRLALLV